MIYSLSTNPAERIFWRYCFPSFSATRDVWEKVFGVSRGQISSTVQRRIHVSPLFGCVVGLLCSCVRCTCVTPKRCLKVESTLKLKTSVVQSIVPHLGCGRRAGTAQGFSLRAFIEAMCCAVRIHWRSALRPYSSANNGGRPIAPQHREVNKRTAFATTHTHCALYRVRVRPFRLMSNSRLSALMEKCPARSLMEGA